MNHAIVSKCILIFCVLTSPATYAISPLSCQDASSQSSGFDTPSSLNRLPDSIKICIDGEQGKRLFNYYLAQYVQSTNETSDHYRLSTLLNVSGRQASCSRYIDPTNGTETYRCIINMPLASGLRILEPALIGIGN